MSTNLPFPSLLTNEPSSPKGVYDSTLARKSVWWKYWRLILEDSDSKNALVFVFLKMFFMFMQFLAGLSSRRLSSITAGFHTGFDCAALFVALGAVQIAKNMPQFPFGYGFDRIEVLSAFSNTIFLIFVAIFLMMEATHRFYEPGEFHSEQVWLAGLGLVIDLTGIFLLRAHAQLKSSTTSVAPHEPVYQGPRGHDLNMHGVFLHALADLYCHVGLLFASVLSNFQTWRNTNAATFFAISILIIRSVKPLFAISSSILLLTTPPNALEGIQRCLREIRYHEGVLEYRNAHWWSQSPGVTIGSLHVRVTSDTNEQEILSMIHNLLKKYVTHLTVQIEKHQPMQWAMEDVEHENHVGCSHGHGGDGAHNHGHAHTDHAHSHGPHHHDGRSHSHVAHPAPSQNHHGHSHGPDGDCKGHHEEIAQPLFEGTAISLQPGNGLPNYFDPQTGIIDIMGVGSLGSSSSNSLPHIIPLLSTPSDHSHGGKPCDHSHGHGSHNSHDHGH